MQPNDEAAATITIEAGMDFEATFLGFQPVDPHPNSFDPGGPSIETMQCVGCRVGRLSLEFGPATIGHHLDIDVKQYAEPNRHEDNPDEHAEGAAVNQLAGFGSECTTTQKSPHVQAVFDIPQSINRVRRVAGLRGPKFFSTRDTANLDVIV